MSTASNEEQLRKLITEYRLMQGSSDTLQQRLELLRTAATELRLAETSLEALKELEKGAPILVPTGGGTFVNANLGDLSTVIVGIGADVSLEMDLDAALENIQARLTEIEKAGQSAEQQLEQILSQMQVHQNLINRITTELRGESASV